MQGQADRVNYLMTKQAKIVAMTCTHAALKRREFLQLGLKYDNLLMEESAQILEIETFIPMLLQVGLHCCSLPQSPPFQPPPCRIGPGPFSCIQYWHCSKVQQTTLEQVTTQYLTAGVCGLYLEAGFEQKLHSTL